MTNDYDRTPTFETLPTADDIARWFVAEMRGVENVGGDAWWLCREPHGAARMYAFVDWDTQEFWLLDITINDTSDLLFVTNGLDGTACHWWQNPRTTDDDYYGWYRRGLVWMADQIVAHCEVQ